MNLYTPKITIRPWDSAKYRAFEIRTTVFIQEQNVPENMEFDSYDQSAWHALAHLGNKCIGTARLNIANQSGKIGRMAVLSQYRRVGIGRHLIGSLIKFGQSHGINKFTLNAQVSAIQFYEKYGIEVNGNVFQDAGIAHQKMILNFKTNLKHNEFL